MLATALSRNAAEKPLNKCHQKIRKSLRPCAVICWIIKAFDTAHQALQHDQSRTTVGRQNVNQKFCGGLDGGEGCRLNTARNEYFVIDIGITGLRGERPFIFRIWTVAGGAYGNVENA